MLGRRGSERAGSADRRDYPRPPLRLNLILLALAVAALLVAARQRRSIDADYSRVYGAASGSPELLQVKAELAEMDLTRETLGRELDGRLAYLEDRKSRDFFLSIDTARGKLHLNLGTDSLRDADVQIGAPAVLESPGGRTWTFVPLKGSFHVAGKEAGLAWRVPSWVYALNRSSAPAHLPIVENGLGKYVILLPNDYVIHSPPAAGSPLRGPKPGSFMVPEADLRAIWDRITTETRVYIF
ncbi:MAG: L,D-transpeptidase [Elusimicrobiota bacterium]|nr:L,D-transpeptidase [Elusimicrobiota bacterium]